ncbi:hypothetical protein S245_052904, partial [Arachis hypogaea]
GNVVESHKEKLPETVTRAEKKQEMAAMEMVMLEHMRHLQGEQREAFEISRRNPSLLEAHVVKNNFLTQTQNSTPILKPPDPGTGVASSSNMAVSASADKKSILTKDGNSSLGNAMRVQGISPQL